MNKPTLTPQLRALRSEVYARSVALIAQGFCKGTAARNAQWQAVDEMHPDARAWCIHGALTRASLEIMHTYNIPTTDHSLPIYCVMEVKELAHPHIACLIIWNDQPHRTQHDVLHVLTVAMEHATSELLHGANE